MDHINLQSDTAPKIGMWLFLFTEMLFFGALFLLYSVYRTNYSIDFHSASSELNITIGTFNTIILLTSSLFMALSISAIQKQYKKLSIIFLILTIFLGMLFLVNKYFEWSEKIHHYIYPGSIELLKQNKGVILFYGLYYTITGIHGLHVLIGVVLLSVMLILIIKEKIPTAKSFIKLENSGLYWHLVDIIWIFIFPLFYLIV